jgi:hypothetical protein
MTARRGQLVLLAAAVVVTALVPMLLAYAQLGATAPAADATDENEAFEDARRTLERSVSDATLALANDTAAGNHTAIATRADDRVARTATELQRAGTARGVEVGVRQNESAARAWASSACPGGPSRAFDTCVVTDGVVTQTRANSTALVAVALDVSVRGPDATVSATIVVHGVRGAVAASEARRSP